jgi:glutaredoxin-related protein
MTLTLYGSESCNACIQAKMLLGQTPIDWAYVDVSQVVGYAGEIPGLQFEDGSIIIGLGAINMFIQKWKQENGFQ